MSKILELPVHVIGSAAQLAVCTLMLWPSFCNAAPGDTIASLGSNADGVTRARLGGYIYSRLLSTVAVSSGRVYAVGDFYQFGNSDGLVARFDNQLRLDLSFDSDGFMQVPYISSDTRALGISRQGSDGVIVLFDVFGGIRRLVLRRLHDSTPNPVDWTVSISGESRLGTRRGGAVAVEPDGDIIVCSQSNSELWVSRRTASAGQLDTTFGSQNGYAPGGVNGGCIDVIVDRQGRIVAAVKGVNDEILLVRFDSNGARDNAFGVVSTGISASLATRLADPGMLVAQPDSRYLVGRANLVRRFNQDGTRDLGYGTNGEVALLPDNFIHEILVAPDATTLIGGYNGPAGTSFVASYNANGSPDETFAVNGVRTDLSSQISGERVSDVLSLAFLPSGDILVGGYDDDDNPPPPSPDLIYFVVTALSFNPGKYPDSTVRLIDFGNPGGLVFASGSGVIYRSPEGMRPGGGGDTYRVYGGRHKVSKMERCGPGLVTVFEGLLNKAYYSPDGHHLGGGGSTLYAYNGTQSIHVMAPYQGGLLSAFSNKKIYRSNGNCYLPWQGVSGFGNVANAAAMPVSIVEFGGGRLMTAYSDGRIYRSLNGTDLGGGGTTVLVHGPSASIVRTMIAYSSEVLTVFQDQQDRIFASMASGSMIPGQLAGFGLGWKFVTMLRYGTGVIAAWDAGVTKPIYKSPSHIDLAGGPTSTRIYNGSAKVVNMLPYQAGLLTAFTNRGIYYSPNGNNPASNRVYYYDDWPF